MLSNVAASLKLCGLGRGSIPKLPLSLQGINRLGKAPPRPGSLRPPDPNRNKTLDVFSEGTEGDADYMRMVRDVSLS